MAETAAPPARAGRGRAPRLLRRLGVLFGTAWRADPRLLTACSAAALGYVLLSLATRWVPGHHRWCHPAPRRCGRSG